MEPKHQRIGLPASPQGQDCQGRTRMLEEGAACFVYPADQGAGQH